MKLNKDAKVGQRWYWNHNRGESEIIVEVISTAEKNIIKCIQIISQKFYKLNRIGRIYAYANALNDEFTYFPNQDASTAEEISK